MQPELNGDDGRSQSAQLWTTVRGYAPGNLVSGGIFSISGILCPTLVMSLPADADGYTNIGYKCRDAADRLNPDTDKSPAGRKVVRIRTALPVPSVPGDDMLSTYFL
jgi:hypothetical protein